MKNMIENLKWMGYYTNLIGEILLRTHGLSFDFLMNFTKEELETYFNRLVERE